MGSHKPHTPKGMRQVACVDQARTRRVTSETYLAMDTPYMINGEHGCDTSYMSGTVQAQNSPFSSGQFLAIFRGEQLNFSYA